MNASPEQIQEVAKRLGLTEPKKPEAVTDFIGRWEEYNTAISSYKEPRFSTWYGAKWANLEANIANASEAQKQLADIIEKAEFLKNQKGDLHDLATEAYLKAKSDFDTAVTKELERPANEFRQSKSDFIGMMTKEARSLKNRISRSNNKVWQLGQGTPEREVLEAEIERMDSRLDVVQFLEREAGYLYYGEDVLVFSESAIWESVKANEYRASDIIERLAKLANNTEGN